MKMVGQCKDYLRKLSKRLSSNVCIVMLTLHQKCSQHTKADVLSCKIDLLKESKKD